MRARQRLWCGVVAATALCGRWAGAQTLDRRQLERFEEALRQEGQAVVRLADAAAAGHARPSDFSIEWHNDFLKAQAGTFVPFIVTLPHTERRMPAVLLYVRLARRPDLGSARPDVAFEEMYPVDLPSGPEPVRISRGFSVPAGEYDLTVVVRERQRAEVRGRQPMAAILRRPLRVPDYVLEDLTTSTVMLADRVSVLTRPPDPATLVDRPYAIGPREVQPRLNRVFSRTEELTVVFLVYHPMLTREKHFDLEVEYHFFRQGTLAARKAGTSAVEGVLPAAQPRERYVTRTQPQRFNPVVLGPQFEPAAGQPVLAGQSVPLSGFEPGDYRLAITVTDLVAGRTIARQVTFTVAP
jgi:hypothetical protein